MSPSTHRHRGLPRRRAAGLAVAAALANGRPVIARGLGRAYGDAAQNAGGLVIDATGLDQVHAFDAERGIVDAGAGLGLEALIALALPHGWFVPVTPGTRHVTLGGALAADVHGKNHHVDGAFSRHVESFELALPGGAVREVTPDDPLFARFRRRTCVVSKSVEMVKVTMALFAFYHCNGGRLTPAFSQVKAPVPDAAIVEPADALIRVTRASILGKIDSGLEALNVPGSARVTIELLK